MTPSCSHAAVRTRLAVRLAQRRKRVLPAWTRWSALVALGLLPRVGWTQACTELKAVYGRGDPWTLALSADKERLFLSAGATVGVYRADDLPPRPATLIERIAVDASILALRPEPLARPGDRERVFVAGGSLGLLQIERGGGLAARVTRMDSAPSAARPHLGADKVCTDVLIADACVLATFAAEGDSELRVYGRTELELLATLGPLQGSAFSMVRAGAEVYLALGSAGLARIDVSRPEAPRLELGPGAAAFPAPEGFRTGQPRVRQVALSGRRLLAAADACGLAVLDLEQVWSPASKLELLPLSSGGAITYASRVVADAASVYVGTHKGPVVIQDGAPITTFGALGYTGAIGDIDRLSFRLGQGQGLFEFRSAEAGLELVAERELGEGWGDLALGPGGVWASLLRARAGGFRAFVAGRAESAPTASSNVVGFAGVDGLVSSVAPGVLLFGIDSAGSAPVGLLRIDERDELRTVPGTARLRLGFIIGARWPDADGGEWVVGGHGFAWELLHLDWAAQPVGVRSWPFAAPVRPAGREPATALDSARGEPARARSRERGREFFLARKQGDLLIGTTHATHYGLVGFSVSELVQQAQATPPGTRLGVKPAFQIATHSGGSAGSCFAWRTDIFQDASGRRILALAAGFETDGKSERYTQPMLQLYALDGLAEPERLGTAYGANRKGNLIGVEVIEREGRRFAISADAGFGLHVFDVSRPERPRLLNSWGTPPNPFDGHYDNVLDVAVQRDGRGRDHAYLAAGRLGLVVIDVSEPARGLRLVAQRDTPGLAYGVHATTVFGRRRVFVGDHQAGLRVYGERDADEE